VLQKVCPFPVLLPSPLYVDDLCLPLKNKLTHSQGVYVSLIGSDKARVKELSEEVEKETQGREISAEEALEKRRMQSGSFGG
jgi:hypothetical protein